MEQKIKVLKENKTILEAANKELDDSLIQERKLRKKVEEEYLVNSKNHQEEVDLRMQFEHKLNDQYIELREALVKNQRYKQ